LTGIGKKQKMLMHNIITIAIATAITSLARDIYGTPFLTLRVALTMQDSYFMPVSRTSVLNFRMAC
jgi:hypothetical protein